MKISMIKINLSGVTVVVLISVMVVSCGAQGQEVTDNCLGCLCEASTGCKKDQGCTEAGVCGPLLISWPYWADGGKYTIKGTNPANAYSECSTDLYCAGQTVRSYMEKYKKDCNGDGIINCDDYAAIHKLGPHACENPSFVTNPFYIEYAKCKANVGTL